MQHDPGYGHEEERIKALERAFDVRVVALEDALAALITIVERQKAQIERLQAQFEEMLLIASHEEKGE